MQLVLVCPDFVLAVDSFTPYNFSSKKRVHLMKQTKIYPIHLQEILQFHGETNPLSHGKGGSPSQLHADIRGGRNGSRALAFSLKDLLDLLRPTCFLRDANYALWCLISTPLTMKIDASQMFVA